jgi:hypothetical protein
MRRVLLVETASPKRVREKAEQIMGGSLYCNPELTILCRDDPQSLLELGGIAGATVVPMSESGKDRILKELMRSSFDVVFAFWSAERGYREMKLTALRIPSRYRDIDIGDGHVFRLTPGSFVRFLLIRMKHPRPTDHRVFVARTPAPPAPEAGDISSANKQKAALLESRKPGQLPYEKILLIQSAEPRYLLRTLDRLKEQPLFHNPRYTLFCRGKQETLSQFKEHPMLSRIIPHSEMTDALSHIRELRLERFDAVVAFFTGDPGYWKIKYLPFLLGARHKVIYNENGDCFFFSWKAWVAHLSYRIARREGQGAEARLAAHARALIVPVIKLLLLPFRFLWLLLVWLRLRGAGLKLSD